MSGSDARGAGWRVAGGMLAVVFVAAGVLSAAGWLARRTELRDTTYRGGIDRIVVATDSGHVTVVTGPDERVRVHRHLDWSFTRPVVRESRSGGTLRLSYDCPWLGLGSTCAVDYGLTVPAATTVEVTSSSGDVTVTGVTGPVTAATRSGDIRAGRTGGTLTLSTRSGAVTATAIGSARTTVRTRSGDVSLAFARRPDVATASTRSGDVRMVVPRGDPYRVEARAASGSVTIRVDRTSVSTATLSASTDSGDLTFAY